MAPFLTGLFRTQVHPAAPDHPPPAVGSCCSNKLQKEAPPLTSSPSLPSVFKLMDQNGDGLLSVEDMSGCFRKLGVELSPPLLSALLSSFPLSHPGFLLFHEFEALYGSVCEDLLSLHAHDQQHHPIPPSCTHDASPCSYPPCHVEPQDSSPPQDDDDDVHSPISSDLEGTEGTASCDGGDHVSAQSGNNNYVYHGHANSPRSGAPCVIEAYGVSTDQNFLPCEEPHTDGDSNDPKGDVPMCHDDADSDDELLGAFNVFDKNADGFISLPELQTVMCNLGFSECKDESVCRAIMQRVDSNGDGLVDFSEFKHMMLSSLCG